MFEVWHDWLKLSTQNKVWITLLYHVFGMFGPKEIVGFMVRMSFIYRVECMIKGDGDKSRKLLCDFLNPIKYMKFIH